MLLYSLLPHCFPFSCYFLYKRKYYKKAIGEGERDREKGKKEKGREKKIERERKKK